MKSLSHSLTLKPHLQLQILFRSSSSSSPCCSYSPLTPDQLARANLLLPRLCLGDHLDAATHLAVTALLANPAPGALSLSALCHRLAAEPGMARPMSILTRLRHAPPSHRRHVAPLAASLAAAYFRHDRPKDALSLFNWLVRPGSPFVVGHRVSGVLINGFCRNGMVFESLKVLRAMAAAENGGATAACSSLGKAVCRGLLREARVREAVELSNALEGDEAKKVLELLDRIIEDWTE